MNYSIDPVAFNFVSKYLLFKQFDTTKIIIDIRKTFTYSTTIFKSKPDIIVIQDIQPNCDNNRKIIVS